MKFNPSKVKAHMPYGGSRRHLQIDRSHIIEQNTEALNCASILYN
ncbi:hypothetical protein COLO4_07539 [Corchorus olitorius]|uniref:Uncharacterized protein n=1 Tax=Corchorus olitorius TaxID=93759 RepID=A0A1R3KJF0_9ROSI|nr:hypothetical protein COLO4_07539 [Corchorus olitorius]